MSDTFEDLGNMVRKFLAGITCVVLVLIVSTFHVPEVQARMRKAYNPYRIGNPFGVRANSLFHGRTYGPPLRPIRKYSELGDSKSSWGKMMPWNWSGQTKSPNLNSQPLTVPRHWSQSLD